MLGKQHQRRKGMCMSVLTVAVQLNAPETCTHSQNTPAPALLPLSIRRAHARDRTPGLPTQREPARAAQLMSVPGEGGDIARCVCCAGAFPLLVRQSTAERERDSGSRVRAQQELRRGSMQLLREYFPIHCDTKQ
ncbi:hypothetical protein B0H13DRAFT_2355222 [Mycena leptocephala]|nr:hypothetical protein B0H13DRAFT_2355222 [Mycena leptocephala]